MASATELQYGFVRAVDLTFQQALDAAEEALKSEGFGVLCRIDIREKFKEKLGVEFSNYVILGACNPPLAHRALQQEINLGLLLPCNAVVYENESRVYVGAIDAERMLSVVGNPQMASIAREVNDKLRRVIDRIAGGTRAATPRAGPRRRRCSGRATCSKFRASSASLPATLGAASGWPWLLATTAGRRAASRSTDSRAASQSVV